MESRTELTKTEKSGVPAASSAPEQTRSGPVYTPAADIFEDEQAITVLADMPGVTVSDLTIDLRENVLTLVGAAKGATGSTESYVLQEFEPGTFLRQFTLAETIDQSKIDAQLTNGVLRVVLPKVEKAKPRQISVRTN
jgi:HSP20 family molecular chaperone IbpA